MKRRVAQALGWAIRFSSAAVHQLCGPGGTCRFTPSCSRYGVTAVERFGVFSGTFLLLRRIVRCRPGGPSGFDPVPATREHVTLLRRLAMTQYRKEGHLHS